MTATLDSIIGGVQKGLALDQLESSLYSGKPNEIAQHRAEFATLVAEEMPQYAGRMLDFNDPALIGDIKKSAYEVRKAKIEGAIRERGLDAINEIPDKSLTELALAIEPKKKEGDERHNKVVKLHEQLRKYKKIIDAVQN